MKKEAPEFERKHLPLVNLVVPGGEVSLPLTYDLKITLLDINDSAGEKALENNDNNAALSAYTSNLKLFYAGDSVYGEEMQCLATHSRILQMGYQIDERPVMHNSIGKLFSRLVHKNHVDSIRADSIRIELDEGRFNALTKGLLDLQEIAARKGQQIRADRIGNIFDSLEQANLWKRPSFA